MSTDTTGPALDAIRVFANSANSVRIFEELTDGPTTSRRLAEATGASRSTVARVLDEGESRGWIASEGSRYELTYTGKLMITEFRTYRQTVEAIQQLGAAINNLPEPAHDLDIRHLRDAEVTMPTEEWPGAHLNRALELYHAGDSYRGLTQNAPDILVRALAELVEAGGLEFEAIIEADFVAELRENPARATPWHAFAEHVWLYPGSVPLSMHIIDQTVVLWLGHIDDNQWNGPGLLETDNRAVRDWAESLYEEYRAASDPLDPGTLPGADE